MKIDPAIVATLLTATGAPIAAAVVWAIIDGAKTIGLGGLVAGHERLWALILSIGIVVIAVAVGVSEAPPRYAIDPLFLVGGVLSVYAIFRLALATHDDANRYQNSLTGPSSK